MQQTASKLEDAADAQSELLRRTVERAEASELHVIPVRHGSPSAARLVELTLLARKPSVVFIEAPSEAEALFPFVVDPKTKPPVALYSSFRDDQGVLAAAFAQPRAVDAPPLRSSSYYPLAACSPEYVAMRVARRLGAEVVFVDLPHYALALALGTRAAEAPENHQAHDLVALAQASDYYRRIAQAGGFRSFDEAWDVLFESRDPKLDPERYRRDLLTFCAGVRLSTPASVLAQDDTLPRERYMVARMRETLAAKQLPASQAVLVAGGFHAFLDWDDPVPAPAIPAGTVHTTLVPYSSPRLSKASGYGAGVRAPAFYQLLYEGRSSGLAPMDVLLEHALLVLAAARKQGELVSAADAIAVAHHTEMLARLRGRAVPVLHDLEDAIVTCCVKMTATEDAQGFGRSLADVALGSKIGRVGEGVGRLPLVADFYELLAKVELDGWLASDRSTQVLLDKRQARDSARSIVLHRARYLKVPIGTLDPQRDALDGSLFRERWRLRYDPAIEAALVELSLEGDTLEGATTTQLMRRLSAHAEQADTATAELLAAVEMQLPEVIEHAFAACAHAIDQDPRFAALARAQKTLEVLDRAAGFRDLPRETVQRLLARAYERACLAVPEAAAVPEAEQSEVVLGLRTLAEACLQRAELSKALFASQVEAAMALSSVPFLRGALLGVLIEVRARPPSLLSAALRAIAEGPADERTQAGDLVHGVLSVSRAAVLLGADELVAGMDEVVRSVDADAFLSMLPRLRAASMELDPRGRELLAQGVGTRYGATSQKLRARIETSSDAMALIAEIDHQVSELMQAWSFA